MVVPTWSGVRCKCLVRVVQRGAVGRLVCVADRPFLRYWSRRTAGEPGHKTGPGGDAAGAPLSGRCARQNRKVHDTTGARNCLHRHGATRAPETLSDHQDNRRNTPFCEVRKRRGAGVCARNPAGCPEPESGSPERVVSALSRLRYGRC